ALRLLLREDAEKQPSPVINPVNHSGSIFVILSISPRATGITSGKVAINSGFSPLLRLALILTISRNPSFVKCLFDLIILTTLLHKTKSNCFLDNKVYVLK